MTTFVIFEIEINSAFIFCVPSPHKTKHSIWEWQWWRSYCQTNKDIASSPKYKRAMIYMSAIKRQALSSGPHKQMTRPEPRQSVTSAEPRQTVTSTEPRRSVTSPDPDASPEPRWSLTSPGPQRRDEGRRQSETTTSSGLARKWFIQFFIVCL